MSETLDHEDTESLEDAKREGREENPPSRDCSAYLRALQPALDAAAIADRDGRRAQALHQLHVLRDQADGLIRDWDKIHELPEEEPSSLSLIRFVDEHGQVDWGPQKFRVNKSLAGKTVRLINGGRGLERIELAEPGADYGRPLRFAMMN